MTTAQHCPAEDLSCRPTRGNLQLTPSLALFLVVGPERSKVHDPVLVFARLLGFLGLLLHPRLHLRGSKRPDRRRIRKYQLLSATPGYSRRRVLWTPRTRGKETRLHSIELLVRCSRRSRAVAFEWLMALSLKTTMGTQLP